MEFIHPSFRTNEQHQSLHGQKVWELEAGPQPYQNIGQVRSMCERRADCYQTGVCQTRELELTAS